MDLPHPTPPPVNVNHCWSCVNVVKTNPCRLRHKETTPQQLLEIPINTLLLMWLKANIFWFIDQAFHTRWECCSFSPVAPVSTRSGLLVSPPSMFSRVKHYWTLGWASFPPSPGAPTPPHCTWLSQGVDVLCKSMAPWNRLMTQHQTNSTPLNTSQAYAYRCPQVSIRLFHLFIFCFGVPQVPPCALVGLASSPILGTCSWNEFNSPLTALRVFSSLSSLTPRFLAYSPSQIPKLLLAGPLPADLSIIELVFSGCLHFPEATSLLRPFLPVALGRGCFSLGQAQTGAAYLSRRQTLPFFLCSLWSPVAFWSWFSTSFSLLSLKSITLDSWDLQLWVLQKTGLS